MAPLLALLALLATCARAGFINVVCEREVEVKPYCGRYERQGDVFKFDSGDRTFTINQGQSRPGQDIEFCLQVRKRLKLCGRQHLDELGWVRGVNTDAAVGVIMEFNDVPRKSSVVI